MRYTIFLLMSLCLFSNCREKNYEELATDALNNVLDTLQFGCIDTTTDFYFKGTLRGEPICYHNVTDKPETGKFFGFCQIFSILTGTQLNNAIYRGNYVQFGFKRDQYLNKDPVHHEFLMDTPNFNKDSTKSYDYYVDSLIKVGNLEIRDFKNRDVYKKFQIKIYLLMRGVAKYKEDLVGELSTAHGIQKSYNYIRCKEKTKLSFGVYLVKFDINCELYTNVGLKHYGNLTGELVTFVNVSR